MFKSGDDVERKHAVQQLEQMLHKVSQIFGKIRTAASGANKAVQIPSLGDL